MMGGMSRLWADKWMRIGSGLGLLLLAMASEKVCPWLHNPVSAPQSGASAGQKVASANSDAQPAPVDGAAKPKPDKPKRQPLPQISPDAPAPRWPVVWGQALARETTGARDGVLTRGPRDVAAQPALPAMSNWLAWLRLQLDREPLAHLSQGPVRVPVASAVLTALCPTGPPRG